MVPKLMKGYNMSSYLRIIVIIVLTGTLLKITIQVFDFEKSLTLLTDLYHLSPSWGGIKSYICSAVTHPSF